MSIIYQKIKKSDLYKDDPSNITNDELEEKLITPTINKLDKTYTPTVEVPAKESLEINDKPA